MPGWLLAVFALLAALTPDQAPAKASDAMVVSQAEARRHLINNIPAVYPMIARAAKVEGVVRLAALIGATGTVEQVTIEVSAPMLDQAAIDAVQQWRFMPFLVGGTPRPVRTVFSVAFFASALSTKAVADIVAFGDVIALCDDMISRQEFAGAVVQCRAAIDAAAPLSGGYGRTEQARATLQLARSFAGNGQIAESLPWFDRALSGLKNSFDLSLAYGQRDAARAYRSAGKMSEALARYDASQKSAADVRSRTSNPSPAHASATKALRDILSEYADVLAQAGRDKDAEAARKKAASLN